MAKKKVDPILKLTIPAQDVKGSPGKLREPFRATFDKDGANTYELVVWAAVDCDKCTFKISSAFPSKTWHFENEEIQMALMSKIAHLNFSAGKWAAEQCRIHSEAKETPIDPKQLGLGIKQPPEEE